MNSMLLCISMVRCCPTLNNYMNFSDTEGVYTHTFEAERNVRTSLCLCLSVCVSVMGDIVQVFKWQKQKFLHYL